MQGGASQSGFEDQFDVLYSVKLKIRPVNRLPHQAKVLNVPQSGEVTVSSSPSAVEPTSTDLSGFKSHPVAGPSRTKRCSPSVMAEEVVYTDGACSRNGRAGSVAGIGVWWGPNDTRCVRRLIYGAGN
jgi:hypothetical protein